MIFEALPLQGAYRIELEKRVDDRGFFARSFCAEEFAANGLQTNWPQMNVSYSAKAGTLRGLHFQSGPEPEVKVLRCVCGSIFDVIVDLRSDSRTFGKWHGEHLNSENRTQLYIPSGFAHGFQSLTDDTELQYFHSAPYAPNQEGGLDPFDDDLNIPWPLVVSEMSNRDRSHASLKDIVPL